MIRPEKTKQTVFEIKPVIEQQYFTDPAVRVFFRKWCSINDSLEPKFRNREIWEEIAAKGILEKRPDGKQNLYLPLDLRLWEIVGIIEAVDRDTFAGKPEKSEEAAKKLLDLANTFQDAGIYLAQRLTAIKSDAGKAIARALAEEFYDYGQNLARGKKSEAGEISAEDLAALVLSEAETEKIDRWLAGDELYQSRQSRAEKLVAVDPDKEAEFYEAERRKTIAQFFRVAEKALALGNKVGDQKLALAKTAHKPWQSDTPIHSAFLAKIKKALTRQIETPKRELVDSIFRRGMEFLLEKMPFDKLPPIIKNLYLHWRNGESVLREALRIDELKAELVAVRRRGNLAEIAEKEERTADKIQRVVSRYKYEMDSNNPSEMIIAQEMNCVGFSMLGGALLREAGLSYLVGQVPEHSVLFLVTSDGQVQWRDMQNALHNEYLFDQMLTGQKKDGSPVTMADIVAFSKNPSPRGLRFGLAQSKLPNIPQEQGHFVTVFAPEYGQKLQVLYNIGVMLLDSGFNKKAIEYFHQGISLDPQDAYFYHNLGLVLNKTTRYREAVEAFRKAIKLDPKDPYPYSGLGDASKGLGRYREAEKAYRKAIALDPEDNYPYFGLGDVFYNLQEFEKAIEFYQKFIDLSYRRKDGDRIKQAEGKIAELKKRLLQKPKPVDIYG